MIELECPMCDGALLVAFDEPELRCRDCAVEVGIDDARVVLAAAA